MILPILAPFALAQVADPPTYWLHGEYEDELGHQITALGDVNGDGYADVGVGAAGPGSTGRTYGLFIPGGPSGPGVAQLLANLQDDGPGYWLLGGGDVNQDGYDDILSSWDDCDAGDICVMVGSARGPATSGVRFVNTSMTSNRRLLDHGDVNGDGVVDLLVSYDDTSNPDRCIVYYGQDALAAWAAVGDISRDRFCAAARISGDIDADGYDDLVVGAPGGNARGNTFVHVYLGRSTGPGSSPVWSLDPGEADLGESVAVGDIDGDGFDDIAAGAPDASTTYVYAGGTSEPTLVWLMPYGSGGGAAVGLGDIDGDGLSDLAVGAPNSAEIALFLSVGGVLSPSPDQVLQGPSGVYDFGERLAFVGDMQGDGGADLIVSDPSYDYGGHVDGGYVAIYLSQAPDSDGDGTPDRQDCAPEDASIFPSASELCDGVDQDCDGVADNDPIDAGLWYSDGDADGFGAGEGTRACEGAPGQVSAGGDCDDGNALIHPEVEERCNLVDDNCDGEIDEGACADDSAADDSADDSAADDSEADDTGDRPADKDRCAHVGAGARWLWGVGGLLALWRRSRRGPAR